jgi:glycosyltransferase involved in cell wall biosynthesis
MTRDIVVNGRFLSRRVTGVERYGRGILSVIGSRLRVEATRRNGIAGHAWEQFVLPAKLWTQPASPWSREARDGDTRWRRSREQAPGFQSETMLWSPANTGPLFVRNQALTIHDLSPLEHPEWFRGNFAAWYRMFLPILAKQVRVIFTPSEHIKKRIMHRFGVKDVVVTPNGVNTSVFHPGAKQARGAVPAKYILFVGSIQPRKNLAGLVAGWRQIKDEFRDVWLVIAGGTGSAFRGQKFVDDERVQFMNYVPDDELPGLYAGAELFVLPSLDEGFGLPALEAMACGAPVLVSNGGALPEVVGDAGLIFDLAEPEALETSVKCCLQNKALRLSLQERGPARAQAFSWQRSAELVWNKLNE